MSIDKIYIFTISPRGDERAAYCKGGLLSMHAPIEKIAYFVGPDHEDYESKQAIQDAAAADGFVEFLETHDAHAVMAQSWGYAQLLRQIKTNNETALVMHDDCYLTSPFWKYESLVYQIRSIDDFRFLSITEHQRFFETLQRFDFDRELRDYLCKGLPHGAGDHWFVVSPAGVDWIFDAWHFSPISLEGFLSEYAVRLETQQETQKGTYFIPSEIAPRRLDIDTLPSLIFDNTLLKKGKWIPTRAKNGATG